MLDSGGYGRVTIDKSVAIIAPAGAYAGISVFAGTNGVDVDGAGIVVALRGLTINGQGGRKESCSRRARASISSNARSRTWEPTASTLLAGDTYITDTTIRDNSSNGILADGSISVTIDGTRIERNGTAGVRVVNGPRLTMTRSVVAGNGGFGGFDIDERRRLEPDRGHHQRIERQPECARRASSAPERRAPDRSCASPCPATRSVGTEPRASCMSGHDGTLTAVVTDNVIVAQSGQRWHSCVGRRGQCNDRDECDLRQQLPPGSSRVRVRCSRPARTTSSRTTRRTSPAR